MGINPIESSKIRGTSVDPWTDKYQRLRRERRRYVFLIIIQLYIKVQVIIGMDL